MPELPLSEETARTVTQSGSVELPASRPSRTGERVAFTGRRFARLLSGVVADKAQRAQIEIARVEKADADRETATFQGFANEQKRLNKGYMSGNDDYETYQANWDGHIKAIDAAQSKIKNAEVKANIGNWLTKTKPVWQLEIDNKIHDGKQERANVEGQVNIREIAAGDYVAEGKALKATSKAAAEKEGREFPDRSNAEWEDTAKTNRVRQIVDSMVDTNIWTHAEGLKFETAAAEAIAAGRVKENEMALEALIIRMGAEQGWDATIDALGDPKFLEKLAADAGLTIGDAAEFTRDMKTLASSRKQEADEAVKAVHRENEILLEKMTRENDPALVPSMVAELFANNQIDKTTRDSYLARLNKRHPVETVRETKYQITEAIRNYKAGDATYEDTEKLLKENLASLSDADLTTLQNSLYSAQEAVNKGTINKAVARRVKVGADYLTNVFKAVGFLGDEDKAPIIPETYEWARFYGERMDQWEQFWELNPEATAAQSDAFANLLTEDVWSKYRNRYLDKPEYEAVDRRIKAELIKLGLQGQQAEAVLDQKQITINDEPADYFEFLENVATIDDPDESKAYYKKWDKGTWPKPTPK